MGLNLFCITLYERVAAISLALVFSLGLLIINKINALHFHTVIYNKTSHTMCGLIKSSIQGSFKCCCLPNKKEKEENINKTEKKNLFDVRFGEK